MYINCNLDLKDKYFLKRNYSFEVYLHFINFYSYINVRRYDEHKYPMIFSDTLRWKCNRKWWNIISEIHQNPINHNNNNCNKWWFLYKFKYKMGIMNEKVSLTIIMLNWDLFYVIYVPYCWRCVNCTELNFCGIFTIQHEQTEDNGLRNSVFSHTKGNYLFLNICTSLDVVPPVQILFILYLYDVHFRSTQ